MNMKSKTTPVPNSVKVQLSRILGENSKEAMNMTKSDKEWRKTLRTLLDELYCYVNENVDSDSLHMFMIDSCFAACDKALEEKDFWPAYTEGIIRLVFLLLGDYPDHKKRRGGRKSKEHYKLNLHRFSKYSQNHDQKVRTLFAAWNSGLINISENPRRIMSKFRDEKGFSVDNKSFIIWFKEKYPEDYSKLF